MTRAAAFDQAYSRRIPALRPGTSGPKAKLLRVQELDRREGRSPHKELTSQASFFGCFTHLGWKVPDGFDAADDEIADLFEGNEP